MWKKKLEGSELHPLPPLLLLLLIIIIIIIVIINVVKFGWKQGKPLGNTVGKMTSGVLIMRQRGELCATGLQMVYTDCTEEIKELSCEVTVDAEGLLETQKRIVESHWECREGVPGERIWQDSGISNSRTLWFNVQEDEGILGIQNIGIEGSAGNSIVDLRQVLKIWVEFISQRSPVYLISHNVFRQFRCNFPRSWLFENPSISLTLRGQALYFSRWLRKLQAWEITVLPLIC